MGDCRIQTCLRCSPMGRARAGLNARVSRRCLGGVTPPASVGVQRADVAGGKPWPAHVPLRVAFPERSLREVGGVFRPHSILLVAASDSDVRPGSCADLGATVFSRGRPLASVERRRGRSAEPADESRGSVPALSKGSTGVKRFERGRGVVGAFRRRVPRDIGSSPALGLVEIGVRERTRQIGRAHV